MWISASISPSTASPTGVEEDAAKMTEEDIEAGATEARKIILAVEDKMNNRLIDILGDEVEAQG